MLQIAIIFTLAQPGKEWLVGEWRTGQAAIRVAIACHQMIICPFTSFVLFTFDQSAISGSSWPTFAALGPVATDLRARESIAAIGAIYFPVAT